MKLSAQFVCSIQHGLSELSGGGLAVTYGKKYKAGNLHGLHLRLFPNRERAGGFDYLEDIMSASQAEQQKVENFIKEDTTPEYSFDAQRGANSVRSPSPESSFPRSASY
jgi:hypothetical protein